MGENGRFKANWHPVVPVRFGAGRLAELPDICREKSIRNPLLITDSGLANSDIVARALAGNRNAGIGTGLFSGVRSNPVSRNVEDGVAAYRSGGHDGVIVFGGGSSLDAGKCVALMAMQQRPLWDFIWGRPEPSGEIKAAPIIAVPTTAGTGSEMDGGAIITNEQTKVKEIIAHGVMRPRVVIGDPELTVGLPANLTAWTGMDALSHSLEAYCVPDYDPMADGMALEGMRLVAQWLPIAVADGKNIEARAQMLAAAMMGAAAFRKGLGAMHALSHAIGAMYDTHHGLTNAVLMPYVMKFNEPALGPKLERLARFLQLEKPSARAVLEWVLQLRRQLGIPHSLAELKVPENEADIVAAKAAADGCAPTNPVPAGKDEMLRIFQAALAGAL
ncbi:MAG TPA: iron-containing alcohol dehydrogenase [Dongiaceae bacterium]